MQNPRIMNWLLLGLVAASGAASVAASVYYGEVWIIVGWLTAIVGFLVICAIFSAVSAAVFGPILWIMSKINRS